MDRLEDTRQNPQSNDQQVVSEAAQPADTKTEDTAIPQIEKISLEENPPAKTRFYTKRWFKITLIVVSVLVVLGVLSGLAVASVLNEGRVAAAHAKGVTQAIQERDLARAKENLALTRESLAKTKSNFNRTKVVSYIPGLRGYWQDADHGFNAAGYGVELGDMMLTALEPYADVLGFTGASAEQQTMETAEDRIIFIAETVEKIAPEMDKMQVVLGNIDAEIAQINENHYPKSFFGTPVREQIAGIKETTHRFNESFSQFQPIVKILPDLLGNPEKRTYLLLFQNDAELRSTGGFLTAYATLEVDKGKLTAGISEDIYALDDQFKQRVPAPDPIRKYLPLVYNWNLRDMNLSPDFKVSMDTFTKYYNTIPNAPEVDGIIALDTQVPVRMLKVLGPIGVGGWGNFSAETDKRCNCPQVIYALEQIADRPVAGVIRTDRKAVLGPLMQSILSNAMGSPRSQWPEFFNIFSESIREKHLLFYFFDAEKQTAVEALNGAGRIKDYDGDYLHINDTNFAGAKSNMFVEQQVETEINVGENSTTKKITITYRNPEPPSNCNLEAGELCLNGVLRNWIRVYVPQGSKLTQSTGSEVDVIETTDLNKTVFEGFFTLAPQSVKKITFEYEVPYVPQGDYRMLIQKQPGTVNPKYTFTLGKNQTQRILSQDTEVIIPLR